MTASPALWDSAPRAGPEGRAVLMAGGAAVSPLCLRPVLPETAPAGAGAVSTEDGLGRLVGRSTSAGVWARYSYDGADVVLDTNSDGTTVEYANGLGVDEKLWQRAGGANALHFVQDHLGSTRALTDAGGNVIETRQYDSFGDGAGSGLTRYGYTGRERDADTGLVYYRARWYDPQAGRFLSEDPIGLEGGLNLYAYVENDPVNHADPLGLQRQSTRKTFCGPGSDNLLEKILVPDKCKNPFTQTFDLSVPCRNHDACYGTCGKGRKQCDQALRRDIEKLCQAATNTLNRIVCMDCARTYYYGVRTGAHLAYRSAQKEKGCGRRQRRRRR